MLGVDCPRPKGRRLLSVSVVGVRVLVLSEEAGGGQGQGQGLGPPFQSHGLQAAPCVGASQAGHLGLGAEGRVSQKPPPPRLLVLEALPKSPCLPRRPAVDWVTQWVSRPGPG